MLFLLAALIFAGLMSLALWKNWRWLEVIAKPAVMILLFAYLFTSLGLTGAALWFGVGLLFSLVGDVLLLSLDRLFIYGLAAFLLAQICYVVGFNSPASAVTLWGLLLAVIVGLGGARVIRRILSGLTEKGQTRMRLPVMVYGIVITLMLLSAMLKLTDPAWGVGASLLVALGAFLFFMSDIILAWNRFVSPIQNGRMINISLYHLGQICIVAGVVMQFS